LITKQSKIFLKLGSQVSGVVETEVWTANKQPVALLAKKITGQVQVIPQQAMEVIPVLSTRKKVIRRQELGWYFLLRRWVFTAVCCGVRSGEFQRPIIRELVPIAQGTRGHSEHDRRAKTKTPGT
jgi:hypothetical protein